MTTQRKALVGVAVVALLGTATALSVARSRDDGVEVRMEEVRHRDLVAIVTASGNIRARRTVDISSDISARVSELLVREGEDVVEGEVLLRLDPTQYKAAVSRAAAALSQARAQQSQQRASLLQAEREFDRFRALYQRDSILVSRRQLDDAETAFEVARANLESASFGVEQAQASLDEAEDRLSKTVLRAPISGKITRLNVEEGETVIIGTMNNPGSLVLTISDLSTVEAVVQVDETDVPELAVGDSAVVDIDAFPEVTFTGRVTEIGNSAIQPPTQSAGQQSAVDFEVVITLDAPPVNLRPDLSATAEIVTERRDYALSIPIIALTVRDRSILEEDWGEGEEGDAASSGGAAEPADADDVEGVFRVRGGEARFVPVVVGITGREHFQVIRGVEAGDTVVAGPYTAIRELEQGDRVEQREDGGAERSGSGGAEG